MPKIFSTQVQLSRCLLLTVLPLVLSSCSGRAQKIQAINDSPAIKDSEIVSYMCQLDSEKAKGIAPLRFTFSLLTGKNYVYDDFSERLVVEDGFVGSGLGDEEVRIKNHIRSALVGDIWKWRHELGFDVVVERRINLKTLEYRQLGTNKYKTTDHTGKCQQVSLPASLE